jgi:hypothetical protein
MRDLVVFDRTQSTTIVKFWDFDWIHLADDWIPMKQVKKDSLKFCHLCGFLYNWPQTNQFVLSCFAYINSK